MKWAIFRISILMCFLIGNLIAISSYGYFYGLEQQRCEKVMDLDYDIATDKVTKCLSYEVSEFWGYTIKYYILTQLLVLIIIIISIFLIAMWMGGVF